MVNKSLLNFIRCTVENLKFRHDRTKTNRTRTRIRTHTRIRIRIKTRTNSGSVRFRTIVTKFQNFHIMRKTLTDKTDKTKCALIFMCAFFMIYFF